MEPIISLRMMLENGGTSLVTELPKYKRRRVSAVRDFPPGCGPNAPRTEFTSDQEVYCSNIVKSTEHPAGDCSEADRPASFNGVDKSRYVVLVGGELELVKDEHANDGLVNLSKNVNSDHLPGESMLRSSNSKETLQVHVESVIKESLHETQKPSTNFVEVKLQVPDALNSIKGLETKDGVGVLEKEEKMVAEGNSPSHHPIPSAILWKERNCPPRRRVSAVRDFPPGCGTNMPLSKNFLQVDVPMEHRNMGSGNNKADARTDVKEIRDRIHGDFVLKTKMAEAACGSSYHSDAQTRSDNDDFRGTSMKLIQPPESPEGQLRMSEQQNDENVQSQQLKVAYDRKMEKRASEGRDTKEVIVYRKDKGKRKRTPFYPGSSTALQAENIVCSNHEEGIVVVQCLMAAVNCPWQEGQREVKATSSKLGAKDSRRKKCIVAKQIKLKSRLNEAMKYDQEWKEESRNKMTPSMQNTGVVPVEVVRWDERNFLRNEKQQQHLPLVVHSRGSDVCLPPFGASCSSDRGARNKVRETLRLFQAVLRKLLQEEETKAKEKRQGKGRLDQQAAKILKDKGKYINTGKPILGLVPGVEVGDVFQYRVELMIIGLHRQSQGGIDYVKVDKRVIATSIVASGGYDNDVDNSDVLTYTGQGGNLTGRDKDPEDQKLERGNLALKNSIDEKNAVRVIRGVKETKSFDTFEGRTKVSTTYTYDGLYTVERYWQDIGPHGKKVYKFELKRLPGQPDLAWKEVKKSKKFKLREGRCVDDISEGKERFPICAINAIDGEKPPPFTYITRMMYPDWCNPLPPQGCDCINGCSDSSQCACVVKNGGEIPYNFDGAIVEAMPLVFECGPSCKCPASCHNRVSQHGLRFQLEIFKTKNRGWGVRSLSSIPSGSFICEYIGELLEDKEAEQRTGNDEYLFDIGQNYNDHSLWEGLSGLIPDAPSSSSEVVADMGFTIDAAQYGNVGRFINHSCSPNLYAQNLLCDHDDRRIPHIMLFAAENIPPLQELTYHYNYTIGQVYDKDGNIKIKNCYCGSPDCGGRMY